MSTNSPILIEETNLSHAWGRAFLQTLNTSRASLAPLVITVSDFQDGFPREDDTIRQATDDALDQYDKNSIEVGAMLIFPFKQWERRGRPSCEEFSTWYLEKFLPRLKARAPANRKGVYFERMVSYEGVRKSKIEKKNQLQHITDIWKRDTGHKTHPRRPRPSALVVGCLNPTKDHTGQPVRGFPCLQQVSFGYDDNGGFSVSAYYPTQYLFDRGYGNYLGICRLGYFMACQLGLRLVRFSCFIGRPERGSVGKGDLEKLITVVENNLPSNSSCGESK